MVFADFNADKYTDVLMLDAKTNLDIAVYNFNPKLVKFELYI